MGLRTPETCWAVNKCQVVNWRDCCIWLVIYLNRTMMHGLTNFKLTMCFFNQNQICSNFHMISLNLLLFLSVYHTVLHYSIRHHMSFKFSIPNMTMKVQSKTVALKLTCTYLILVYKLLCMNGSSLVLFLLDSILSDGLFWQYPSAALVVLRELHCHPSLNEVTGT